MHTHTHAPVRCVGPVLLLEVRTQRGEHTVRGAATPPPKRMKQEEAFGEAKPCD